MGNDTCVYSYFNKCCINDIKAKFENGILQLSIPKKDAKTVEQQKHISIEG